MSRRYILATLGDVGCDSENIGSENTSPREKEDAVSVRGSMLELAILGELQHPLHGYELRKRLARTLGPLRRLSFGSLYPALHRLEERGLIRVIAAGSPGPLTPDEKATPKGTRKQVTYQITPAGSEYLITSLGNAAVDDDSLPLTMGLMSQATPATRLALLMQRRKQVLARAEAGREGKKSSDFWIRSKAKLDSQQAQNELDWIDQLIQSDAPRPPIATGQPGPAGDQ